MRKLMLLWAAVAAIVVSSTGVGRAQAKIDMTGKWVFNVQTEAGAGTPTFTVKQEGEKISGHYVGTLGEADFTGTNNGKDFTINFAVEAQGMKLDCAYKGTFDNKDAVKGTLTIAGLGDGTFTGKRQ